MPLRRWTLPLVAALAFGQEAAPFPEAAPRPWVPDWEVTLRGDRVDNPVDPAETFQRAGVQLRLRWTWEAEGFRLVAGTRSAFGSDGNRFNAARWDNQPSNGTQLDVVRAEATWLTPRAFGSLNLGLQESGLLASEALWDRDLRFLGAGGRAGFRTMDGVLQEAGLRGAVGRVRNILGGRMDLAAGQLVLKADTGPWSWTAHAGRWNLSWDPGEERLRRLPRHNDFERQSLSMDAVGAAARWNARFPFEARWFRSRNRENRETSEEVQASVGSRERVYWPYLSYTWQRLSSTGTLYPVNGDEWWFYRSAQGYRLEGAVPLPGHWSASLVYFKQSGPGEYYEVTRTMLVLVKRF